MESSGTEPGGVANIQAICQVSYRRAVELLEAASGSFERAVDCHLRFQQNHESDAIEALSLPVEIEVVDMTKDDKETVSRPPAKKSRKDFAPGEKEKARPSSPKPTQGKDRAPRQISKSMSKQAKIQSFFYAKSGTLRPCKLPKDSCGTSSDRASTQSTHATAPASQRKRERSNLVHDKRLSTESKVDTERAKDPRLSYARLAKAFSQMTDTTKRNEKLNILKTVLRDIIEAVGGIYGEDDFQARAHDARVLTSVLELLSGKISLGETVAPAPLQISGAAVSGALQAITGVSKNRLREVYQRTGDLGDVAAEFFDPAQSVKNFFLSRRKPNEEGSAESNGATVDWVHGMLLSIATVPQGAGSQKERHSLLVKLMRMASSKDEIRFLVRSLISNLRVGATVKSILASLAMAVQEAQMQRLCGPQDPVIQTLQKVYDVFPRISPIANALLCGGISCAMKKCSISLGIPIQPMLANPAHSLSEVETFMTKKNITSSTVFAEWKYDGMRCQAHGDGAAVKLFSRHLRDSTFQFPDAIEQILEARRNSSVESFIIDAEIVGISTDCKTEAEVRLLPFQILSTRRGTKSIAANSSSASIVQVRVFAFDLMYLNGTSLLEKPLVERIKLLRESFQETKGFSYASSIELPSYDEVKISEYLQKAVEGGAEGLMMKLSGRTVNDGENECRDSIRCAYEAGTRSQTWLKVKRDYVKQFADTIDVVPIGAWFGNGRKAQKGFLSPILLAVYDEDDGVFRSISRCMSFTDAMYQAVKEFYFNGTPYPSSLGLAENDKNDAEEIGEGEESGHESDNDGEKEIQNEQGLEDAERLNCFPCRPSSEVYVTNESPTIWFKPKEVWEVSFADLTMSRVHTAAAGLLDEEGRGIALRFPRFIRRRPDKSVEQATTCRQVAELFAKQFKQR